MEEHASYNGVGWQSDLTTFHSTAPNVIRSKLQAFVRDASREQITAWDHALPWLQDECRALEELDKTSTRYITVLEYELPRDFRRPDVIVLERGTVVVLELKGSPFPTRAALDQVRAYARDLAAYHAGCANVDVIPILVVGGAARELETRDGVMITSPVGLASLLNSLSKSNKPLIAVSDFLRADAYQPLPGIVTAARDLFHKRPLPLIKRARAATDPALHHITLIAHEAAKTKTRHLVLLSGVPGSGKTLVGLQLVHAHWLDELAASRDGVTPTAPAVYLSGNAPLVKVLQHALAEAGGGGRTFVRDIKSYVSHHSRRSNAMPLEHLLVFDEAQRAHDAERFAHVHDVAVAKSEPEHLIEFCERVPDWCVLVALIGDGQAIHVGEETGVKLWCDALNASARRGEWTIHATPSFQSKFNSWSGKHSWHPVLNLDTELRFHLTPKVHSFVAGLLESKPADELSELSNALYRDGHRFLITRSLDAARSYLFERYEDAIEARYGLIASSKDRWLVGFGVDNSFQATKQLRVGPWYNAAPADRQSCCQLTTVATEFSSQGLELDCALLAWGSDLLWDTNEWSIRHSRGSQVPLRDPLEVRKNVYRVLLTRGRDGTVIYVPQDVRWDKTYERLMNCGIRNLEL